MSTPSTPSATAQPPTFEAAMAELETLIVRMEGGQLPLAESLAAYRRGAELLQFCQATLADAQQQVQVLENGMLRDLALAEPGKMNAHLDLSADPIVWQRMHQTRVAQVLERELPSADKAPQRLHRAMRYAVLGAAKRVRPLLAYAAAEFAQASDDTVDCVAAAVEMIHCYSLIHDDLPCMDDDVLRRGRPTVHVAFDEATALLAGDALQSLAFVLISNSRRWVPEMTRELAVASGSLGMAGGQAIDLESVGVRLPLAELEQMHRMKTGALITASVVLGGYCGNAADGPRSAALRRYAACIGLAFQIVDDVLDAEATTEALGKTAGKDSADNKPNYVAVMGLEPAKTRAKQLASEACDTVGAFGQDGCRLQELAELIVLRQS